MNSPKSNTPLLRNNNNNFFGDKANNDAKHVRMMDREFSYLDGHLKKLANKEQVKRFKYYAKKRISFYYYLLKSEYARSIFSKSALSLINKIAKRLDSAVTKLTKLFQRSDADIGKYLQRSHVSRNYDKNSKGILPNGHKNRFLIDELKQRTLIHLKRYLAKIPPTNIEELKAFQKLFENRAAEDMFENKNQNVKNIKNTLEFRINKKSSYGNNIKQRKLKLENELKKNREIEFNRHLRTVAGHKLKPKLAAHAQKLVAKKQQEAKQRLERAYLEKKLKQTAEEENAETERILTQRRDDAALRLQSMGRMRSAKHTTNKIRSRQQKKRKEIEERLRKNARFENRVTSWMENRREAERIGHERRMKREELERKRIQEEENEARKKLFEGRKINNSKLLESVLAKEVEKALAGSPQRSPSVRQQQMRRSPPANASIIYVRPNSNGRIVNTPGFNANGITNKRQRVVRSEEETLANKIKRYGNEVYYMFAPFSVRK